MVGSEFKRREQLCALRRARRVDTTPSTRYYKGLASNPFGRRTKPSERRVLRSIPKTRLAPQKLYFEISLGQPRVLTRFSNVARDVDRTVWPRSKQPKGQLRKYRRVPLARRSSHKFCRMRTGPKSSCRCPLGFCFPNQQTAPTPTGKHR